MGKIVKFHDHQILITNPEYEQFAYLYSKSISDEVFADEDQHIDKYVVIQYRKKKIYRKCAAYRTVLSNEISLGNRSIRELGLKSKDLGTKEFLCTSYGLCRRMCFLFKKRKNLKI